MKGVAIVLALGLLALSAQGGVATFLPPPYCPNLALLFVLGVGLQWPGTAGGLAIASVLGYATDLVSGSLLGQHALIWLFVCGAARLGSRRLNLRGPLPLMAFAGGMTFFLAGMQMFLTGFFSDAAATLGWGGFADVAKHALVNGLLAPAVSAVLSVALAWASEDEARQLELSPGRAGS